MSKTKKRPIAKDNPNDTQTNIRMPGDLKEKYKEWAERLSINAPPTWTMNDVIIRVLQRAWEERGKSGEP